MGEKKIDFPGGVFRSPDVHVAESKRATIYGYTKQKLVVKEPKANQKFYTVPEVLDHLRKLQADEQIVEHGLIRYKAHPEVLVRQSEVIHNSSDNQGVTYSRVQAWQKDAKPLAEIGTNIFKLPRQSLVDLKAIFAIYIETRRKKESCLDIVGSTTAKKPFIQKLARQLLPLFYSENIMIGKDNIPKFIDIGGELGKSQKKPLKTKLSGNLQLVGAFFSIAILQTKLTFTHNKLPAPNPRPA